MNKRLIIQVLFCTVIINTIFIPISNDVARIFGYISIILLVLLSVNYDGRLCAKPIMMVLFISFAFSCFFSADSYDPLTIRKSIVSVITFFSFYSVIQHTYDFKIPFQFVLRGSLLLSVVFLVYSFAGLSFAYTPYGKYGVKVFSMGLGNPNAAAVYVLFVLMVFLIEITHDKNTRRRILYSILSGLMVVIVFKLNSRTVIVCLLVAIIASVFNKKPAIFDMVTATIPFATIPVLIRQSDFFSQHSIFGKALNTGRDEIYISLINFLKENPFVFFTGSFFNYPFTNLHNAPLTIFATIGIFGLASVIVIWIKVVKNVKMTLINNEQVIAYIFLFLFIAHSSMEAMTMIGTVPYCVFVLVILLIAKGIVTE